MAIKTTGLDHVHVFVRDLDGFLTLFGRLFDSEQTMQSEIESIGAFNSTLRFSGATSSPFLDLFEPASEDGPVARALERRGEGVTVLSFGVDDLESSIAHAEACGLRVVSRIGFPGVMAQVQFDPADTFGFQLELVQYEPGAEERIAEIQRKKAAGEPVEGLRVRRRPGA
jgi:methylmalonyl-CoA/ethylmalonyl-CoA epimerase